MFQVKDLTYAREQATAALIAVREAQQMANETRRIHLVLAHADPKSPALAITDRRPPQVGWYTILTVKPWDNPTPHWSQVG